MEINLCMGCMRDLEATGPCPHCGFEAAAYKPLSWHLPPETILGGKYLIGRVIQCGDSYIKYIGINLDSRRRVEVQEYFPQGLVTRNCAQGNGIFLKNYPASYFNEGLGKYVASAKASARPANGITTVKDVFYQNNTAYMVSAYIIHEDSSVPDFEKIAFVPDATVNKWDAQRIKELQKSGLPLGSIIQGRYRIERVLDKGRYGMTCLCTDLDRGIPAILWEYMDYYARHDEKGALIVPSKYESQFNEGCQIFMYEMTRLKSLEGLPGVVSYMDCFYWGKTVCAVMEYVHGITLPQAVKKSGGYMAPEIVLNMMRPVIRGLGAVHRLGLLHDNIHPRHILVDEKGRGKLIDFSYAVNYRYEEPLIEGDPVKIERLYREPVIDEGPMLWPNDSWAMGMGLLEFEGKEGPWTDVFGICAAMYYALTGKKPEVREVRGSFPNLEIVPMSELGITVPPQWTKAIMKGLSMKPEDRFQTMEALEAAFYGKE